MTSAKLTVVWALVAFPLLYGLFITLTKVAALFG
ncbi:MFS transporter small subunit [Arthrobacter terrae]